MTVSIVDYGLGNLGSVENMFRHIGVDARRVSSAEEVLGSDRVLLPGVGAFDHGVARLQGAGLFDALKEFAGTGRPMFGICLGMQLLFNSSEEGDQPGLGLIAGRSTKFVSQPGLRIPHMGWNSIEPHHEDPLIAGAEAGSRFYFVHSYHVEPANEEHVLATSPYGGDFVSMVSADNVQGAQFHPEKSHTFGMTVLGNFARL